MAKRPLLIFPKPSNIDRTKKGSQGGKIHLPEKGEQIDRVESKMSNLDTVLKNETAYLQDTPHGLVPEMILVMEIAGDIQDFFKAVAKTPGMEFLSELEDERDSDDFFYRENSKGEKTEGLIKARLFLTMTNQQALRELQGHWEEYKKAKEDQDFATGTTKFRNLFEQLIDLRPYSVIDRIRDTGLEEYLNDLRANESEKIKFEIELAYRSNSLQNQASFDTVSGLLAQSGGKVMDGSRIELPSISYHAFIAEAPINSFDNLTNDSNVVFLKAHQIIFFRPVGQLIAGQLEDDGVQFPSTNKSTGDLTPDIKKSRLAILDGLPLNNHDLLKNLIVDDPDNFSNNYLARYRLHGTAMASIVLHGDLSSSPSKSLTDPVYLRPILKSIANDLSPGEYLPDDRLPIDLVHRAVVRMFEKDGDNPPVAPNVKVINFSIGDTYRPFHFNISTWARLIDWLSYKYDVFFIISTGNYVGDLSLDIAHNQFDSSTSPQVERKAVEAIIQERFDRRILAPSESINSLTIGASHNDASDISRALTGNRKNVIFQPNLLSPISRIGFGFKRSVKPEALFPGGRKFFRMLPQQANASKSHLRLETFPVATNPPGVLVATPGNMGTLDSVGYIAGTSASAALASHHAGLILEMLDRMNSEKANSIPQEFHTVVTKALVIHGASWGAEKVLLESVIKSNPSIAGNFTKKHLMPFIGYGAVEPYRVLECTDYRVSLIGFGTVKKERADLFSFPLPPSMSQKKMYKRLTLTLAWLTPINYKSFMYRQCHLYYTNLAHNSEHRTEHLSLERAAYDFDTGQNGTVQHDILEGENADAFVEGNNIEIKVNCREDASGLSATTLGKYALIVTLEVKETDQIPIYDEIEQLISVPIQARVRGNV
jgi:hypothetical protein